MRHNTRTSIFPAEFGSNLLVVLLLGFGLGMTTLLYTAFDRLLLHPVQVPEANHLVRAGVRDRTVTWWTDFPYSVYLSMRSSRSFAALFEALAVEGDVNTTITENSRTEPVFASMVSGSYFSMLDAKAELGRVLIPADESAARGVPVVLSHRFWMREFGGSSTALGTTLHLQGKPFTVVGVMPQRFFGTRLDAAPDLWMPLAAQRLLSEKSLTDTDPDREFSIIGRVHDGVSVAQAQSEFAGIYRRIREQGGHERQGLIVPIAEGSFALREQFSRALSLLLWGLAALLAMVCASVAGILIARSARRERETAVRMALGASHLRMAGSALAESALLATIGASCGIALAYLCAPLLTGLLPAGQTPLSVSLLPDAKTDGMIFALALAISAIFGTIPAWLTARVTPHLALRGGSATRRSGKSSQCLMIFEAGATLVLLTGTGLLLHTFDRLRHSDPGFDVNHLVTFTLDLPASMTKAPAAFPKQLAQRVMGLPGVRGIGFSGMSIMHRIGMKTSIALPGERITTRNFLNTSFNEISSGYFDAMGIPLVAGREFEEADASRSSPTPAVVNEAFARIFLPGKNPLGKTFGIGAIGNIVKAQFVVIGIVGDSKYRSLRESLLPIFYLTFTQHEIVGVGSEIYLYVRTTGRPEGIISAVRKVLFELDPQLPFAKIETMQEQVHESLWQERLLVVLAALFSGVSVSLVGLGLYALLVFDQNQRTREFGIRMALGAQRSNVALLMISELARILTPGLLLGWVGSVLLAHVIAPMLYEIGPYDALSWSGALFAVVGIGAAAVCYPAVRAMSADPAIVLREE